jgi:hypothetical protein
MAVAFGPLLIAAPSSRGHARPVHSDYGGFLAALIVSALLFSPAGCDRRERSRLLRCTSSSAGQKCVSGSSTLLTRPAWPRV